MSDRWHVTDTDLDCYAAGRCSDALAASVEEHLMKCADCRGRFAAMRGRGGGSHDEVERRWAALADVVDRPRRTFLVRLGLGTPALRPAWLAAFLLAFAVPLLLGSAHGVPDGLPLLIIAPLVPVLATALAFRPDCDPAGELALALPGGGFRQVVARSVAVGALVLPFGLLTAVVLRLPADQAVAWLLPGIALSGLVLLSGCIRMAPVQVATGLMVLWVAIVLLPSTLGLASSTAVLATLASPIAQSTALAVALAAALAAGAAGAHADPRRLQ